MSRSTSNLITFFETLPGSARSITSHMATKPLLNSIFRNKDAFLQKTKTVKFDNDGWKGNPQAFCSKYYGDQFLYPIILMCNNIGSMFDFRADTLPNGIIAPDKSLIFQVLSQIKVLEDNENG